MMPWIDLFLVEFVRALAWVLAVAVVFIAAPVGIACASCNGPRQRLKNLRAGRAKAAKS